MNLSVYQDSYVCITFEEANILTWNVRGMDRNSFIHRLDGLIQNTSDKYLLGVLKSLQSKIQNLTETEFKQLCSDAENNKMLYPGSYQLPYIEP